MGHHRIKMLHVVHCVTFGKSAPWCSGLTCHPVTVEIAGSNPVGVAISYIGPSGKAPGGFRFSKLKN